VPPPHENDWLSRPDRQALWVAGDNAQLEHNTLSATDSEIPRARQVDRRSWERGSAMIDALLFTRPTRRLRARTSKSFATTQDLSPLSRQRLYGRTALTVSERPFTIATCHEKSSWD